MLSTRTSVASRDQKVTVQSPVITDGAANSDIITWDDLIDVWARVTQGQGTTQAYEQYEADRLTAEQKTIFNIRYRGDLNTRMQIIWNGRAYRVIGIVNINRNRELDIVTEFVDETL